MHLAISERYVESQDFNATSFINNYKLKVAVIFSAHEYGMKIFGTVKMRLCAD